MNRRTIFFYAVIVISTMVWADDGGDFYHQAAHLYISGNLDRAISQAEEGLKADPQNPKLQALLEILKQEKEQQEQQQQNQEQQQQNQEQQQQNQENSQDQQQEEQQQNQEQQQQQEQEPEEGEEQQQQQQQEQDEAQQNQEDEQQPQPGQQEEPKKELSKEEAERILQALRSKEKENQKLKNQVRGTAKKKVEKDW